MGKITLTLFDYSEFGGGDGVHVACSVQPEELRKKCQAGEASKSEYLMLRLINALNNEAQNAALNKLRARGVPI